MSDDTEGKHGVQSLEVGMGILKAMVTGQRSMMLKDIAAAADMPPSKAHRYLVSLIRSGMVEQDPLTSRYNLGAFALNIGLVAIDRLDRIRLGMAAITELRDAINETTALAVWSDAGPVIVRWERAQRPITVNVVTGTALGMLGTAAGRVFSAWLPHPQTDALIERELAARPLPRDIRSRDDYDAVLAKVRADRVSTITDHYVIKGVEAISAPVFNFRNEISMAISVVGVEGMVDMGADSHVVIALKKATESLSRRLGATTSLLPADAPAA